MARLRRIERMASVERINMKIIYPPNEMEEYEVPVNYMVDNEGGAREPEEVGLVELVFREE